MYFFDSARAAMRAYMKALGISSFSKVMLPAYVGWSNREGSGVFDPVRELGATPIFYNLSARLEIDLKDAMSRLVSERPQLLVIIHYFGFPDLNAALLAGFARSQGVPVLEDEAHSMLSDLVGGACGRWGDAAIYSLHKLLPFRRGGALVLAEDAPEVLARDLSDQALTETIAFRDYDLYAIAERRRANADALLTALRAIPALGVIPLHESVATGVVPQTLPVIINHPFRDELYFQLNAAGFGVVSLYYALIKAIEPKVYPEPWWVSGHILNLPVHQDVEPAMLDRLVNQLATLVTTLSRETNASNTTVQYKR